jgi:serine-type D-Ala-D-Ala carboxypeptidase
VELENSRQRQEFAEAISILNEAIASQAFPGAAFAVFAHGKVQALDCVGRFTYEAAPAVTPFTVFDLASVTKVIATTSMAMLLYQRGQLHLDQPVVELLPDFAQGRTITLRLLLAHASGLPGYARLFNEADSRDALLNACLRLPLTSPPGTQAEYSDPGFILLGRALEVLAEETLDEYCGREIFAPLGMRSTRFRPPAAERPGIPPTEEDVGFRHRVIQGEVQDENCFVLGGVAGHAGLFSDALDPLRYAQGLFEEKIFTQSTVDLFTTRAGLPAESSRALGWDTPSTPSSSGQFFSRHSAGHLGYSGTSFWVDFERRLAIVLLTNRTWPHRQSQAIRTVRPAFHDAVMKALGEAQKPGKS